jgi:hypothetical protein
LPQFLKSKTFLVIAVIAVLVGVYAMAGFWLAPRLVRNALMDEIPKTMEGINPSVGEIRINPFLLHVEIHDFILTGARGTQLVGFKRLFVDFEALSSIWHRAYTFKNIDLTEPFANAVVFKDGHVNLEQLSPKPQAKPKPEPKKAEAIPAARIGLFKVAQGYLSFEDRRRPSDFATRLAPINFELQNFSTGVDGGHLIFTAVSKQDERIEGKARVSVQPIESDGEIRITSLQAHTLWDYLKDQLNFQVNSGKIDINAAYQFSYNDKVDLKVQVPKASLTALAIRPKNSETDWIELPEAILSGAALDLDKHLLHADALNVTGLKIEAWLEPDGSLNLLQLEPSPAPGAAAAPMPASAPAGAPEAAPATAPTPAPAPTPATAATPATAPTPASTTAPTPAPATATATARKSPPSASARKSRPKAATAAAPTTAPKPAPAEANSSLWQVDLREFALHDANISAEDRRTNPVTKVVISPLSLKVDGASLNLAKPVTVALDAKVNGAGSLNVSGDVTPQPVAANLNLKVGSLNLEHVQPYVAQYTSMTLMSGALNCDAKLKYDGAAHPALQVAGNLSVAKLHTVDNALRQDFINWDRVDVEGLKFQFDPNRLDIDRIAGRGFYARVIIEPDTSLNVKRVLAGPAATVVVPVGSAGETEAGTATPSPPLPRKYRISKRAAAPAPAAAPAKAPIPFPVTIKKIVLTGSKTDFTDLSVMPNFSAGIEKLEGSVAGLSSDPSSRAKVDMKGSVGEFSPVSISGDVNLLSAALYTDLSLNFSNIELTIFNPYSGKFAGYNISKGKLNTDLHYKVDNRKLDAQHHIVVDQLEFGEKTESKEAVSLPVKLAVSLLKDKDGVIDLNLPVTGTLDDPKFRLGPVIWKVLVNLLEKAVTAPFKLLGSLFGGGPDLQFVDFQPGSADLDPAAVDKAHSLVKALNARPQLKIEVPIATVKDVDRPRLVEQKLQAQLHDEQAASANKKSAAGATDFTQLEPAAQLDILNRVYKQNVGGEPKYPESITSLKSKPEATSAKIEFLTNALREHIEVSDADLTKLAQQRATNVQQALLTDSQLDPGRVFLVANDKAKNEGGLVRLELSLR